MGFYCLYVFFIILNLLCNSNVLFVTRVCVKGLLFLFSYRLQAEQLDRLKDAVNFIVNFLLTIWVKDFFLQMFEEFLIVIQIQTSGVQDVNLFRDTEVLRGYPIRR